MEIEISDQITPKQKMPKFIFEKRSKYPDLPFKWKIIKVDKGLDKDRIDKSIIMQLPASSKYEIERNLMNIQYKKAFFLALSRKLALTMKEHEVIGHIESQVEKLGILREYQTMREILGSKEKFNSMIYEARRKWTFLEGEIGSTARREFIRFIEDISKGIVGVINIWYETSADNYLTDIRSSLSKYNVVHIYSRGKLLKSGNLRTMEDLKGLIKQKIKRIQIDDKGIYDWESAEGKVIYKAHTMVLRKK
jgi:hypothetical protein